MTCIQEWDLSKNGHTFGILAVKGTAVLNMMELEPGLHNMSVFVTKKKNLNSFKKRLKIKAL